MRVDLVAGALITANEFAGLARLSRRQIDRLRRRRPPGFPREYELGSGRSKYRRCPRFNLAEASAWTRRRLGDAVSTFTQEKAPKVNGRSNRLFFSRGRGVPNPDSAR